MRRRSSALALYALLTVASLPVETSARSAPTAVPHGPARVAAPPAPFWVGFSPLSSDVHRVGAGGSWDFDTISPGYADSTQGWSFLQGGFDTDAGPYPLPSDRPWWYLDHGNAVNGVRQGFTSKAGLVGVWHRDNMLGISSPIIGSASAWCGLRAPGDVSTLDPATANPYNGDQQVGDFADEPHVRSGWPGYADQWDQLMYRDFPSSAAALGFLMRVRLSPTVPPDPNGSAWFTPDPTNPAHLELNQPDRFRVWVGVPYTGPTWDPDRLWLSEVLEFSNPAAPPAMLFQATGFDPPLAAGPDAFTPVVGLPIPDYSGVSPLVRVVFQVKTNRIESDFRPGPGGFDTSDGAVVLDDVDVGGVLSTFEAVNSIVHRTSGVPPTAAWITTGKPAPAYGHIQDLASLFLTSVSPCDLAGNVMVHLDHDQGEMPVAQSSNWAVSPTLALSGPRAAAQGIPATLRDNLSEVVIEFDYYAGPVTPPNPELTFSLGIRYKGFDHLWLLQPLLPQVAGWSPFHVVDGPATLGGDSCRVVLRAVTDGFIPWQYVDSVQVAIRSWANCDPGTGCTQQYGAYFDNIRVGFVERAADAPVPVAGNEYPVTFSVNGPVDPHTEGIRDPRGGPVSPQAPVQPGNSTGFGIRSGPVPPATGIPGPTIGDVSDYDALNVPAEAVMFQSAPPTAGSPQGGGPAGVNNQVVEPEAAGLVPGPGLAPPLWVSLPPDAPARDNIDAISFGTDYFPPTIVVGPDPASPLPPAGPPAATLWSARTPAAVPPYAEPVVIDDGPGVVFHFSVDPWAIGLPATAVRNRSGGADLGGPGTGPWTSPGAAAGAVFETQHLVRSGGLSVGGGGANATLFPNAELGLAPSPPPLAPMEDDVDALESRGLNLDWRTGQRFWPGNVHGRVRELGVDPAPAGASTHEPRHATPVFFSVTRNSTGAPFSAVRSQFVIDGGAAADIFVAVKDPAEPAGTGTNFLFIDNLELGLMWGPDFGAVAPSPDDYSDDLDGLVLSVCPELRAQVIALIDSLMEYGGLPLRPWTPWGFGDARYGPGMTVSITKMMVGLIPPGCIKVGFSVTTDAVGLANTAVDWEAGPVDPAGGTSTAAGDVFYTEITGEDIGTNYLWHEEVDLGLSPGAWVNGISTDLEALADNLDALDSDSVLAGVVGVGDPQEPDVPRRLELRAAPNPFVGNTGVALALPAAGIVRVRVLDVAGRVVATIADGWRAAGRYRIPWDGRGTGGRALGAGVYFAVADFAGQREVARIVRLR